MRKLTSKVTVYDHNNLKVWPAKEIDIHLFADGSFTNVTRVEWTLNKKHINFLDAMYVIVDNEIFKTKCYLDNPQRVNKTDILIFAKHQIEGTVQVKDLKKKIV